MERELEREKETGNRIVNNETQISNHFGRFILSFLGIDKRQK